MIVHLLRHAEAENIAGPDSERPLTARGLQQAEKVAEFLARTDTKIDVLLSSPYHRARQTADAIASRFSSTSLVVEPRLKSGMSQQSGLQIVQSYADAGNILLVGHQPDLGNLATFFLTRDRSLNVDFPTAALLTLELFQPSAASGMLLSYLCPAQM